MNRNASPTAARWARSIVAAVARSATAHNADTLFTGENVRSDPATAWVCGREYLAIAAASSRASAGGLPCSAAKELPPHLGADPSPISYRYRPVRGHPGSLVQRGDPLRHLDPER